jgi:uncharacterized protein YjiS (DUF1127 family)
MTSYAKKYPYTIAPALFRAVHQLTGWVWRYLQTQVLKHAIVKERQQLAELSETILKDIGIDRTQAMQESARQGIPASRRP